MPRSLLPRRDTASPRSPAPLVLAFTLVLAGASPGFAQSRPLPGPVVAPEQFREAIEAGTRTDDGTPGPGYWQQRADYVIEASIDVETALVRGSEVITYANNSPDALDHVVLHLDQNVFAPGARRNRRAPVTGGVTVHGLTVDGAPVEGTHPGNGYYQSLTLLEVPLPAPLESGDTVRIGVDWSFTVPPAPTFRTGNLDFTVFAVAQWYPRMAVYDDVQGWDLSPYLGDGEFYLEYGDFDVSLSVPAGWLIGATGTLQNPTEVLGEGTAERLRAAQTSDTLVRVVRAEDRGAGRATRGSDGDVLTWRFAAENVRDFAWATSDEYVWDAIRTPVPEAGMDADGSRYALAQALYRPEFPSWFETARYAAHTIRFYSRALGPYLYPQVTITEGPVGGMEYPMMVFNPSGSSPRGNASVTIHEAGHQWFPMMVGTQEAKHAFMDEGFNSYFDEMSLTALLQEDAPRWGLNRSYLGTAGTEREVPLMRHTDLASPYGARTLAAYTKPAVVMGALREVVGQQVFDDAFREYTRTWTFKHPRPWDFFNTVERHAGRDLDWFWQPLFYDTAVLDQAVAAVEYLEESTTVTIRDQGDVILPSPVRLTLADGTERTEWISEDTWLSGTRMHRFEVAGRVVAVVIDPDGLFPDVDRSNNQWMR